MRSIEFLAPVESMRGNLSGKQNLVYPTKDNRAWSAPSGVRSYARNYGTRYIGSKRAADGRKIFSVKQRSAVTNSPAQRMAQALMGAAKPIADFIMNNLTWRAQLNDMLVGYHKQGLQYQPAWSPEDIKTSAEASIRHYLMRNIRDLMLIPKNRQLAIQPQSGGDIVVNNPWYFSNNSGTKVSNFGELLVKFWQQLSTDSNPIYFNVSGLTGLALSGESFDDFIGTTGDTYNYTENVLGLSDQEIGGFSYVKIGTMYLILKDGTYVKSSDDVDPTIKYYLTATAPTA